MAADELLARAPAASVGTGPPAWADLHTERAFIAGERYFVARLAGRADAAEGRRALARCRALLPPLPEALLAVGPPRQAALSVRALAVSCDILPSLDDLAAPEPSPAAIRRLHRVLQEETEHFAAEAEDERRRGLDPRSRRNYPAWWQPGRTEARHRYWLSLGWGALARALARSDPAAARALIARARQEAAQAAERYRLRARRDGADWSRLVLAILHQADVERAAGDPDPAGAFVAQALAVHRADLQVICLLTRAERGQERAAPGWKREARRTLREAQRVAGADAGLQQAVARKGRRVLGAAWPSGEPKRRHRAPVRTTSAAAMDV